jgi:hypothetical protein
MVLTADEDAKFRKCCEEIKSGEYGRVVVSFVGEPSNIVDIIGEKRFRFHHEKAKPTTREPIDRGKSGRY